MYNNAWKKKVINHLEVCEEIIEAEETDDLGFRMTVMAENAINLLTMSLGKKPKKQYYQLELTVKNFASKGLLSKDYSKVLAEAYEYHREDSYVQTEPDEEPSLEDMAETFSSLKDMVVEIEAHLKKEGHLARE